MVFVAGQNDMRQLVCCRITDESDAVFVTDYHAQTTAFALAFFNGYHIVPLAPVVQILT